MPRLWLLSVLACLVATQPFVAWGQIISIGVLNQRSETDYTHFWELTAKHLSKNFPGNTFVIKPMGIECLSHAVSKHQLDFVITNPAHFIVLEKEWNAYPLASLESRYERNIENFYGATIITNINRPEIKTLSDLKRIHFMASNPQEFGGFLMTWRALLEIGVDPHKDLFELYFSNHNDAQIVQAVLNNDVDAAVIQSGVLERLEEQGILARNQINVLNPSQPDQDAVPIHSTQLYPEWQFVALESTEVALASRVAKWLKNMPKNETGKNYIAAYGWAQPQDLTLVHGLLRALKLPPYAPMPRISLRNLFQEHLVATSLALTLLLFLFGFSLWMRQVNRQLALSRNQLAAHRDNLKKEVSHRTLALHQLNEVLEQDILARQKIEHTLRRSQRALQGFYQILVNPNLTEHQKLLHLMQLARRHFKMESVFLYQIDTPPTMQPVQFSITAYDGNMALNDTILDCLQSNFLASDESDIQSFRSPSCDKKLMSLQVKVNDQLKCILAFGGRVQKAQELEDVDQEILKLLTQWIRSNIERQEIAQERENYRLQLGKIARLYSVGEMASGLAHEINQPLTAATNYVSGSLLRLKDVKSIGACDAVEKGLTRSLECLNQTSNIIRRLREFVQTGAPTLENFDFATLARNVLELVETEAKQKGVHLILSTPDIPHLIQGDRIQLEQVLLNLVRNGVDACDHGGEVQVVISQTANLTHIAVKDNGKGIDPKELPKIFDLFHTSKPLGMGLGLAICRSLIDAHGSRLLVKNGEVGAEFSFTLRQAETEHHSQPRSL